MPWRNKENAQSGPASRIFGTTAALTLLSTFILALPLKAIAQDINIYDAILGDDRKTLEVSTEHVRRVLADGSAMILDARKRPEYNAGHIPGALNFDATSGDAVAQIERLVNRNKNKALILYCNGPFCQASRRLGERLVEAGFTDVRRYQLGIPIWRALGGPTEIELEGIVRIFNVDRTAVFIDARSPREFAKGSLPGARNIPAEQIASGVLDTLPLPKDDFNTRVVLFGRDFAQARALADAFSKKPWHNVTYYPGKFETLRMGVQ